MSVWQPFEMAANKSGSRFLTNPVGGLLFGPTVVSVYLASIVSGVCIPLVGAQHVWQVVGAACSSLVPDAAWVEPTAIAVMLGCYAALLSEGLVGARTTEARSNRDFIVILCTAVGSIVAIYLTACVVASVYQPSVLPHALLIFAVGLVGVGLSFRIGTFWIGNPAKLRDSLLAGAASLETTVERIGPVTTPSIVRAATVPALYLVGWYLLLLAAGAASEGVSSAGDILRTFWFMPLVIVGGSSAYSIVSTSTTPPALGKVIGWFLFAVVAWIPVALTVVLVPHFLLFTLLAITLPSLLCTVVSVIPLPARLRGSRLTISSAGKSIGVRLLERQKERILAQAIDVDALALNHFEKFGTAR